MNRLACGILSPKDGKNSMENDAFVAGIVPGGLTSHSEVKILCCYLVNIQEQPVSHDVLVSAVSRDGLVNYFELVSALTELTDSGQLSLENGCYSITESGKQIATLLAGDLPFSVRSNVLSCLTGHRIQRFFPRIRRGSAAAAA